jgi:pyruvate-formate lyase-activating enzyme
VTDRSTPAEARPLVEPVHDFARKLRQDGARARLLDYVGWRREVGRAAAEGRSPPPAPPTLVPVSLNLDLTTACNYLCDHCIDFDTLNSGVSHRDEALRASLRTLAGGGLRSVILIGGGEPTLYPGFAPMVAHLKDLGLEVAVVSNGSRNDRLLEVASRFTSGDWVRLSLDAGTDATFQAMHHPRRPVTLEAICAGVPALKARNPALRVGFSFVITWRGAERVEGHAVVENVAEMAAAARLARDHGFDYVSYKPFLVRTDEGAEVVDPVAREAAHEAVLARIREGLASARALERPGFEVVESTNLKLLLSGRAADWTRQPRTCHLQAFRQVLSPLGLYNCPAHRGVAKARVGDADAWAGAERAESARASTAELLERFDASVECREVTCLYHAANWWIEHAIATPGLSIDPADGEDLFL